MVKPDYAHGQASSITAWPIAIIGGVIELIGLRKTNEKIDG
jgi:hypothetical protein